MAALQIPCPKCGSLLKLKDRSLLGRTGKCPKCAHRFVLNEPEEVELELAPPVEEPVRVAAARRVPDATTAPVAAAPFAAPPSEPVEDVTTEFAAFAAPTDSASGASRFKELQKRRSKRRRTEIIVGGVIALVAGGLIWASFDYTKKNAATPAVAPPGRNIAYEAEKATLQEAAATLTDAGPTKGEPITLRYVPAGASVVIHLRPAELWKDDTIGQEVRYCLGPLADWAAAQIDRYALAPPSEVEEATICVMLGSRGSAPETAGVFRYSQGRKPSDLVVKLGADLTDVGGTQVYVGEQRSYLLGSRPDEVDAQGWPLVVASAPANRAADLAESAAAPGLTSDAIEQLLERTDRTRHLTLVFQPLDLRVHEETLAPAALRPAWNAALDRLGEDAEAAAWSVHFAGDEFFSELLVRNTAARTPKQVYEGLKGRLDALPTELVAAVSKMDPPEIGNRKVIGRFPAMMQIFAAATAGGIDDRLVRVQTRLPERAGPNLALAALLAWDESTRTDFTKKPADAQTPSSATPAATLAERLKKPIEVEFNRTPLEEAFTYIGTESGVEIEVDGEALKFAGYTKNMPQTFTLGKAPAEKAIAEILKQYDKMCVVLDEKANKALVLTKQVAEERKLTPTTFAP